VIVFAICARCIGATTKYDNPLPFMGCFFGMIIFGILAFICAIPLLETTYKEAKKMDEQPKVIEVKDRP
jgi:uncharacterized membrane protein